MVKAKKRIALLTGLLLILVLPIAVFAEDELTLSISTSVKCDQVDFSLEIFGGDAPYTVLIEFGDEESYQASELVDPSLDLLHTYPAQGEYEWNVTVEDRSGLLGESEGVISLDGPSVTLGSEPFPPLLTIESGEAAIRFTASVSAGTPPYSYAWDLDGNGIADEGLVGEMANFSYSEAGNYTAQVQVTDGCGFTASDTLTVVVVDPEEDSENACHPTALKIAEAVSSIFPDRAEQTYTCKDIFDIFEGAVFGYHVGFGRMWHAYQLTQRIDELTWEDILDWHLNYSGWGALLQLDRFAGLLETHSIGDLLELVTGGEQTVGEIRSAVRATVRYDADFEDALARINAGATNGKLGQFYKLAGELEVDPAVLDAYLADGLTLSELSHAAKFADRMNAGWTDIVEAKSFDQSWGEIGQAFKLANDEYSAADILAMGAKEFRTMGREEDRTARAEERTERTAERLAGQFEVQIADVLAYYNGECAGSWGCVQKMLRDKAQTQGATTDRDERSAAKIASQYGYGEAEVWSVFESTCAGDWNCVRSHFRAISKDAQVKGKNK